MIWGVPYPNHPEVELQLGELLRRLDAAENRIHVLERRWWERLWRWLTRVA